MVLCCCYKPVQGQSDELKANKHGFVLSYNACKPLFFGEHINNIAHGSWDAYEFNIGISSFKRLDILYYYYFSKAPVTDRYYVNASRSKATSGGILVRYGLPINRKFTAIPKLKVGLTNLKNQGSTSGSVFGLGCDLLYAITKKLHVRVGLSVDEYFYEVRTSPSIKKHYGKATAFMPIIGLELNTNR